MKKKAFYILAFICCMSFLSSAKQMEKRCPSLCKASVQNPVKKTEAKVTEKSSYDLSPLSLALFNL